MQAVTCRDVGCFSTEEIPEPVLPGPDWVKIQVRAAGLCGSDLNKLLYSWPPEGYLNTLILGHETAGTITEIGHEVTHFKAGDRVAIEPLLPCQHCDYCKRGNYQLCPGLKCMGRDFPGGFAQFVCVRQEELYLLPSTMSFAEGALIDPVAAVIHCFHLLGLNVQDLTVAVVGDGFIGLICIQVARVLGASHIVLFGKHKFRLELGLSLGASQAVLLSQDDRKTNSFNNSFNIVIEAVGGRQSTTLHSCINLVSPGGVIGVLGVFDFEFIGAIPLRQAFYQETKIIGSNSYSTWNGEREFEVALHLIRDGFVNVSSLITHRFPLGQFHQGVETARRKAETGAIKIVFEP